ncbi:MAG: hypothetical protein K6E12_02675 [Saccharofermentans sp.]|nr:hypothetical protein [Saccharofermentans sp.]
MKKSQVLAIIMAISIFMSFAMGSSSSGSKKDISDTSGTNADSTTQATTTTTEAAPSTPTIEEEVVYDEGGVKITAKEYTSDSIWGDGIKFLIENDTEQNITVGCTALIVNNYMITDLFVAEVAAGKKTNETMNLLSSQLKAAGIETIGQVEIYFHIYDSDTWDAIADPDCITIRTSMYDQMDTTVDDAGQVLYEEDGIKIVGKYVDDSDFWGAAVLLYIENNSGTNVVIHVDNLSVNGFTMNSAIFSSTVYDGKMAYDSITLLSSELEENDITSVEEITLTFRIIDADSYSTITESDEISFYAA